MNELLLELVKVWGHKIYDIITISYYSFLTIWCIFLQLLYYIGILQKFQFSIFLIVLLVSVSGFIITYIHPKKYVIPIINFDIKGIYTKILDILFHHIPLLIFSIMYNKKIKKDNTILFWVVLLLYLAMNNPFKIYYF